MSKTDAVKISSIEEDSTIKVDSESNPASASKSTKGKAIKKAKTKGKTPKATDTEPWEGVLEGTIERSPPDDEQSKDISGICVIKVHNDDSDSEVRESLYCLFCSTPLGTKGEPLTPPRDS